MARSLQLTAWLTSLLFLSLASCAPKVEKKPMEPLRMLNHWDNLDGTVERGYSGKSLWWNRGFIDTLNIKDYGMRNQAIGVNGTVIDNVNARPIILSEAYLDTVTTYANLLRPYGIRMFLAVNFSSPIAAGATKTADPLDRDVQKWWEKKCKEIYARIPDFGGFLVKANSEGNPGPCDYGRTHAEGANMLARALKAASPVDTPDGVCIWRAFVYSPTDDDRAKQAYTEFANLDGQFDDNVIIQVKNGPIDFQPREPVSPLFFAMKNTRLMAELQITQEYLGQANHIAYLGPMWTEFIEELRMGGSMVNDFAGVSNIGITDGKIRCGNLTAESNWFAFGLLTNDPKLQAETVIFSCLQGQLSEASPVAKSNIVKMLKLSREAVVDYMMPLGLHHLFAFNHHYGPEPWCDVPGARRDWMPKYYHQAEEKGIGFDRTLATGTKATLQYPDTMRVMYESLDNCPEKYLLWFHHVDWNYTRTWECCGKEETLWQHLGRHYQNGVEKVQEMQTLWAKVKGQIADNLWEDINMRLTVQAKDAVWWNNACLLYFQEINKLPWPSTAAAPKYKLEDLKEIHLNISNFECPSPELLDSKR